MPWHTVEFPLITLDVLWLQAVRFGHLILNKSLMAGRSEDLIQGTLDMLILKTLTLGRMHGYAIVQRIQLVSKNVLQIEEGSLYPALHRMEQKGWIESQWGVSENNRRARYYSLTRSGRKQLKAELSLWAKLSEATSRIADLSPEQG